MQLSHMVLTLPLLSGYVLHDKSLLQVLRSEMIDGKQIIRPYVCFRDKYR